MSRLSILIIVATGIFFSGCGKNSPGVQPPPPGPFRATAVRLNNLAQASVYYDIKANFKVRFSFNAPLDRNTVNNSVSFKTAAGVVRGWTAAYENNDSTLVIESAGVFEFLTKYKLQVSAGLTSNAGLPLTAAVSIDFVSSIDSSRKFPTLTDNELLDKIQQQTFKYFWDFGHPTSGLARERNNGDNNIVTSGGSGFGVMAILVGINRGFITRAEGLARMQTIVGFLKNTADKFHGAFPHWLSGETGKVVPFSANDSGADLVETSYLLQGLLCARQYFDQVATAEATLRTDINTIWNGVEWDWFRKNNENTLYWHWTDANANGFIMNMPIKGWNECLITYILAASSTTHGIPKIVYDNGWAGNGTMKNGATYYNYLLPFGPNMGGPLFFSHYSFLGVDPNGLTDTYGNYETQTRNHTLINYEYCVDNPGNFNGYSDSVWGLTASDVENGYRASSPTDDAGFIAPTAAISSLPYTPDESMAALKFYYYVLGDKIWKEYGFVDAFSLHSPWFANSFLAIDQGPIILMIENYRSGLLWELFTSCPEVQAGMSLLNFSAPYL